MAIKTNGIRMAVISMNEFDSARQAVETLQRFIAENGPIAYVELLVKTDPDIGGKKGIVLCTQPTSARAVLKRINKTSRYASWNVGYLQDAEDAEYETR